MHQNKKDVGMEMLWKVLTVTSPHN